MRLRAFFQALKLGDFSTKLEAEYDYSANKDFLKEVTFTGDLIESSKDDDVTVSYEVTHDSPTRTPT